MKNSKYLILGMIMLAAVGGGLWYHVHKPVYNLILITLDTTRPDHLGIYNPACHTPALDAIGKSGAVFERAYCNVPLTLPSHSTIMTGLYPPEHGCRVNGETILDEELTTLAEVFKAHHYDTAAFVASFVLDSRFGLAQGFDEYSQYEQEVPEFEYDAVRMYRYRRGNEVADSALSWLRVHTEEPFFCWIHFFDPHRPYYYTEDSYANEIRFMDQQIGRLIEFLQQSDLLKKTIIIAMGDHGEGLGDHGEDEHGLLLYDSTMHVPLLMTGPDIESGQRIKDTVSSVDMFSTITDLMGWKPDPNSGRSFARSLDHQAVSSEPVYMETLFPLHEYNWSPIYGVVSNNWKYIQAPEDEMYDLQSDPGEIDNVLSSKEKMAASLNQCLYELTNQMKSVEREQVVLDAKDRRVLESLGYSGGSSDERLQDNPLRNPMDAVELRTAFINAVSACEMRQPAIAESLLKEITLQSPETYIFKYRLAKLLFEEERYDEAAVAFKDLADQYPESYKTHYNLGKTLIKLRQYDQAIAELNLALQLDQSHADGWNNLGIAQLHKKQYDKAIETFRKSLEVEACQSDPNNNMGNAYLQKGELVLALPCFQAAVDADPASFEGQFNLGSCLMSLGQYTKAIAHLQKAVDLQPRFPEARRRLAIAVRESGR